MGREVAVSQFDVHDYHTRDEQILIDVVDFTHKGRGASVTVYPLGFSTGPDAGAACERRGFALDPAGVHR